MTWIRLRNIGLSLSFAGTLFLTACGSEVVRQSYAFRGELETSTSALENAVANTTWVQRDPNSFIEEHGTQVEYRAPNGTAYLWYPGNRQIVVGKWKIQSSSRGRTQLCFRYGPNTYNPVTRQAGGRWRCAPPQATDNDILRGNPFGLSSGPVPFVIKDRGRYYPEHFMHWLGKPKSALSYVSFVTRVDRLQKKIARETGG